MGKEAHEGEMRNDGKTYWPGTDIEKSMHNDFTHGFGFDWAKAMAPAGASAKVTSSVERRRKEGTDFSTFHGMSKKADATRQPHGGVYMRARPKGESKASRIRQFLTAGPKDSLEIGKLLGIPAKHARALLQYDVERGTVVKLHDARPTRYALAEAA